jgi:hypothetical protein
MLLGMTKIELLNEILQCLQTVVSKLFLRIPESSVSQATF